MHWRRLPPCRCGKSFQEFTSSPISHSGSGLLFTIILQPDLLSLRIFLVLGAIVSAMVYWQSLVEYWKSRWRPRKWGGGRANTH